MIRRPIFFCLMGCFFSVIKMHAQNNTSPYSMIGIGDIEKSMFDRTSGMGHAGLALSSNRFLFQGNPASYAKLDEHFFYFEVATRYKSISYSGAPITDPAQSFSADMQFKKIALAIKPKKHWAISVGLMPFSTSNYSFYGNKNIQGSNLTTSAYYEGTGSTNQFYVANSFEITKNLSVGLQTSYLFGQLQETETIAGNISDSVLSTNRNIFIGNPYLKLGIQYKTKINKQWDLALGATISNKTRLKADYNLLVKDGTSILVNNEYYKSDYFTIPVTYAGGIAATYQNTFTFALDYNYQGWSSLNYKGISYSLVNSQKIAAGVEYSKKLSYLNQSFEKYFFQGGFFYNNSYLRIAGQQLTDVGATIGAGVQLARSGLGLQGALEIGTRGTTNNGLIKEKYTQFNITISYRDFWLSRKMKKYD
ncbi:MAG: outer membrane protein [Sediminibacterium sp.]|nr:outer membrane protein [Sediminibacterium sp.]